MKGRSILLALVLAFCVALPVGSMASATERSTAEWAVYMYFGADNDYYQATEFCVEQTLKALEETEADPASVVVIALVDGPNNGDTKVYELTKDGRVDITHSAFGTGNAERTMTDPETMIEFLDYALLEFPAESSMLVLKNGHAWCGICPDNDNTGNEKLLMPIDGLAGALETVYDDVEGAWIDVLMFDGDNMGSIEVAYELREVTDYFVGSQQQIPLEGMPYYLFMSDLVNAPDMSPEQACIRVVKDYVDFYNNTEGKKTLYDKLIANSQMAVTAAAFRMGEGGEKIEAVVESFNTYLDYMLYGELPEAIVTEAEGLGIDVSAKLDQWMYPDPTTGELVWSWIPLGRNNISSARDVALIGKMNDQQGFEWLPDVYTWLWSMSALTNYDAYGDSIPPSGDTPLRPELTELKDPFIRMLLEDFMEAFGYVESGIYRGIWNPDSLTGEGALVWVSQCHILDRSGNSFPHGLNIWFPPTWLQWDEDDEWSDLFNKPMTYTYSGIGVWIGIEVLIPAEYYCIDCPEMYQDIGLDFTEETLWMTLVDVYYDSRWLIYGYPGGGKP
ncbi:MAG: hypothetical protein JSV90_09335 [Methanobacteriota archaeon]|nr:MAG: hypothetical protein JSV90_09335 [Euryarchaeota archaeon]